MAPKEAPKPNPKDAPKGGAPVEGDDEAPPEIDAAALAEAKLKKTKAMYAGCTGRFSKCVARNPLTSWCKSRKPITQFIPR